MLYVCIVVAIGDERGCASCCATSCCCCRCSFVFVDAVGPVFGIVEADDVPYVYVIFLPFPLPSGVAVIVVGGRPPRGDIPGRRPEGRPRHRRRGGPQR